MELIFGLVLLIGVGFLLLTIFGNAVDIDGAFESVGLDALPGLDGGEAGSLGLNVIASFLAGFGGVGLAGTLADAAGTSARGTDRPRRPTIGGAQRSRRGTSRPSRKPMAPAPRSPQERRTSPFQKTSLDLWNRMIAVNLTGSFLCAQAALPQMR